MKKYFILTFGCQMNESDSERIASLFESIGFKQSLEIENADLIIVNMCSVRQSAVDRILGLANKFKELKKTKKKLKTILTGCVLEPDKDKFVKIFDFILNKEDLEIWPQILAGEGFEKKRRDYLKIVPKQSSVFQGFVPVSNGCDNFCTYCAVPYTRGRLICRKHTDILKEVKILAEKGYKEIWLLGENVNSYNSPADKKINFAEIIKRIEKIKGDFWLRFTSPHPKDFSDELIEALAKSSKFAPYINLPAQSGDDVVLRKMNRPYTAKQYIDLVKKIKQSFLKNRKGLDSQVAISTDIIVGFPTETEEQFMNTVNLFNLAKFDMAFIAQYSPRPQSHSYKNLKDDVKKSDKKLRHKRLTEILCNIGLEQNKIFLDKTIPVLIFEEYKGYYLGRNRQNKAVKVFSKEKNLIGKIVNVKVVKILPLSLEAEKL
ncbi:MAG: tRNA (N6-isopentenyl adenosine(37)-C2)-methylthiotransferase MiaB [Candidatus Pacebacteria bacterium]|nr:tRNA (N6-isopentenyl adenosine(37)-C2)-methylthiotransferase MiaB [Candidatus Paceibacterota bacterium]